jgi:uncharacterized membrane protein HdeD (DUF308 family)
MPVERHLLQKMAGDYWWLVLIRGIAVLCLGLLMVSRPGMTLVLIIQFLGAYLLVDGIFTIINSQRSRKVLGDWRWALFTGILGVIAGIVVFSRPLAAAVLTTTFLVHFIALLALASGFSSIFTGIRLRKEIDNEWSMILGGLLYCGFGILLLGSPMLSMATLIWVLGILAIGGGLVQILASFKIRSFGKTGAAPGA